jgi:hypothetical protein
VAAADWAYAWPAVVSRRGRRSPIRDDWTDRLASFLSPVGTAHAHGAPITGDVWLLELFIPDDACSARVFSTADSWTTDDATRARISTATVVEAELTWAYMEDAIVSEGPARRSGRHTVTVEP